MRALGVLAILLLSGSAPPPAMRAVRAPEGVRVDGALEEAAWRAAPAFDAFVQLVPTEGATPSERTEVRLLYDDRYLYVGITCHDSRPSEIAATLGRRDAVPPSDAVTLFLDPAHDHRTGYRFTVNAAGVQGDALLYSDTLSIPDWDAKWDAAVSRSGDGWSVELAIPFSQLSFTGGAPTWGVLVQRELVRTHELLSSAPIPRNANALVSLFGHLDGLGEIQRPGGLELSPYLGTRAVVDSTRATALSLYSADLGLDARATLPGKMLLNATVNPDFSQVEADQIILNLTNFEEQFPEKRPFFLEGVDVFQPLAGDLVAGAQSPFFSRRIGLGVPILAAAKLTGDVAPGIHVGILDAFLIGPGAPTNPPSDPDLRLAIHPERPFHLGPNAELPALRPTPANHLAAVTRVDLAEQSSAGATLAMATPLGPTCTDADLALPEAERPGTCSTPGGNSGALELQLKTSDGQYAVLGQLVGSQVVSGPPQRMLLDGTVLGRGDLGHGGFVRVGKLGGEPLRFDAWYMHASPRLELNPTGFQLTQNEQRLHVGVEYQRPTGVGPLRALGLSASVEEAWTTDGALTHRGHFIDAIAQVTLPSFDTVGLELRAWLGGFDVREIHRTGIRFLQQDRMFLTAFIQSDATRPFVVRGWVAAGWHAPSGPTPGGPGWGSRLVFILRPHPVTDTQLTVGLDHTRHGPRFIEQSGQELRFGDLLSEYLSLTLRQQLALTPRLSLQAYAQVFTGYGLFGPFFTAPSDSQAILPDQLAPAPFSADPSFQRTVLNLSAVARWEYGPGSTLYLVYTHSRASELLGRSVSLAPTGLQGARGTDGVMLKLTFWWWR